MSESLRARFRNFGANATWPSSRNSGTAVKDPPATATTASPASDTFDAATKAPKPDIFGVAREEDLYCHPRLPAPEGFARKLPFDSSNRKVGGSPYGGLLMAIRPFPESKARPALDSVLKEVNKARALFSGAGPRSPRQAEDALNRVETARWDSSGSLEEYAELDAKRDSQGFDGSSDVAGIEEEIRGVVYSPPSTEDEVHFPSKTLKFYRETGVWDERSSEAAKKYLDSAESYIRTFVAAGYDTVWYHSKGPGYEKPNLSIFN